MPRNELVQSVTRAMEILEAAAYSEKGLRLNEVAESLGVKVPTAHNLLRTLISKGLIEKTEEGIYRTGERFFSLAEEARLKRIPNWAKDTLKEIYEKYPFLTITYSERRGNKISPILRMSPDKKGIMQTPSELSLGLYWSASGLAFLAFASAAEVESIRDAVPFMENGSACWGNFENLQTFLEDVREKGYSIPSYSGIEKRSIAAPVFNRKNEFAGTLGLSIPGEKPDEKIRNEMTAAALKYSKKLSQILKTGGFL